MNDIESENNYLNTTVFDADISVRTRIIFEHGYLEKIFLDK